MGAPRRTLQEAIEYAATAEARALSRVREKLVHVGRVIDLSLAGVPLTYRRGAAPVLRQLAAQIEAIANAWAPGGCKVPAAKDGGS